MKRILMASTLLVFLAAASCKRTEKNVSFDCTVLSNTEKQSVFLDLIELEGEPITMDTAIAEMGKAVAHHLREGPKEGFGHAPPSGGLRRPINLPPVQAVVG